MVLRTSLAFAWLEQRVQADEVEISVQADGLAVVSHRMLLRVRGGPLKTLVVSGVDADAMLLPGATLTRAKSGQAAGVPMALIASRDGEQLQLELVYKRGVSSGVYLVQFSYNTDFKARGLLRHAEDEAELLWTGPSLPDGVDSLRVQFSFPRADEPPHLLSSDGEDTLGLTTQDDGVYLSQLLREGERDVFILTRPHAAKNERVKWRVQVDSRIFGPSKAQTETPADLEPEFVPRSGPTTRQALRETFVLIVGSILSLLFVVLVMLKSRARGLRFLFKLRRVWRVPTILLAALGSVMLSVVWGRPTEGALLLGVCILFSVQLPKRAVPSARGPGRWEETSFEGLLLSRPSSAGPALLDVGRPQGALLFAAMLSVCGVVSLRLLGVAPYYSAMTLVYACACVPLFCTLGTVALPALVSEREQLSQIRRLLEDFDAATIREAARYVSLATDGRPQDAGEPDELRLVISVPQVLTGFLCMEVGSEQSHGLLWTTSLPVVIVRVRDGSAAHDALPREAQWSRGRESEERVALLRPQIPTAHMCADLVRGLIRSLTPKASQETSRRDRGTRATQRPVTKSLRRVA